MYKYNTKKLFLVFPNNYYYTCTFKFATICTASIIFLFKHLNDTDTKVGRPGFILACRFMSENVSNA